MRVSWPLGVVRRGRTPNHPELRWLATVVVSVREKAQVMRQVGTGKASASEPLTMCRKYIGGIGTGVEIRSWDKSGGCPVYWPGGARHEGGVSPVCGFCVERGKAGPDTAACRGWVVRGSASSGGNRETSSTVAGPAGGPARSSDDAS